MPERRRAVLEGDRVRRITNPDDSHVEAGVLSMTGESVVALSETDDDNTCIQVWQRSDGLYRLEHRAGSPVEHFQTVTVSAQKVHTAFKAWLRRDEGWSDPFTWKALSELF